MTHFRPSMIATMVASALTVGTIGAVNATPSKQLNISADTLAQAAQSAKAIKAQKQRLSNETTVSGMKNTFDAQGMSSGRHCLTPGKRVLVIIIEYVATIGGAYIQPYRTNSSDG